MTTIIAGILMLGALVFIHELGHFSCRQNVWCQGSEVLSRVRSQAGCSAEGRNDLSVCAIHWGDMYRCSAKGGEKKVKRRN